LKPTAFGLDPPLLDFDGRVDFQAFCDVASKGVTLAVLFGSSFC